jgi:hypothetical protein
VKLCHIPPARMTHLIPHGCMTHLCVADIVVKYPEYGAFYRSKSDRGDFVILDSGAFEAMDTGLETLLQAVDVVRPSEVVLLDKFKHADQTVWKSIRCAEGLLSHFSNISQLAVVPQGNTYTEYVDSVTRLARIPSVTTFCVIEETLELFDVPRDRVVQLIRDTYPQHFVHLLGPSNDLWELKDEYIQHAVRSCDTSKFVVWGLNEQICTPQHVLPYPGRESLGGRSAYFDFETNSPIAYSRTVNNIKTWEEYLNVRSRSRHSSQTW